MTAVASSQYNTRGDECPTTVELVARFNYEQGYLVGELSRLSIFPTNYPVLGLHKIEDNTE